MDSDVVNYSIISFECNLLYKQIFSITTQQLKKMGQAAPLNIFYVNLPDDKIREKLFDKFKWHLSLLLIGSSGREVVTSYVKNGYFEWVKVSIF